MNRTLPILVLCILPMLAPPALAGHVQGQYDLCSPIQLGSDCFPNRNPCGRENGPLCPPPGTSCIAYGLLTDVDIPLGLGVLHAELARSEASSNVGPTTSNARQASFENGYVRASSFETRCNLAYDAPSPSADAVTLDLDVLGVVTARALTSHVEFGGSGWATSTTFQDLQVLGTPIPPEVHDGTQFAVSGAIVTVGETWISGGVAMEVALRIDFIDTATLQPDARQSLYIGVSVLRVM